MERASPGLRIADEGRYNLRSARTDRTHAQATITIDFRHYHRPRVGRRWHRADAADAAAPTAAPNPWPPRPHKPHHSTCAADTRIRQGANVFGKCAWFRHRSMCRMSCDFKDAPGVTCAMLLDFCARRPLAQCLAYGGEPTCAKVTLTA